MMESNLVKTFINETHCDIETAYACLQSNCWDINAALESWRYLNTPTKEEFGGHTIEDQDAGERNEVKKLSRGISRATDNVNLVSRARCEIAQNFKKNPCLKVDKYFIDTPEFTFTLPDLNVYGDEFRRFLEKDLIEKSTLISLEQSGRLNWWTDNGNGHGLCQRLWPLATTGDGNCLLHAASLAMWGFHDRLLTLRRALHMYLDCSDHKVSLYRRWRWQQTKLNEQSGFVYSENEWAKEWQNIINMASTEPRKNGCSNGTGSDRCGGGATTTTSASQPALSTYESLEEIHVLALAHVLRRPIIVVADVMLRDMNNEPFAPIPFGGVYLPLECSPKECHRSPLLLTYDMAHFSALVAMENSEKEKGDKPCAIIPLTDSDGVLLPIQFSVDPGPNYIWSETHDQSYINSLIPTEKEQISLLKEYLNVVDISDSSAAVSPDIDSEEEIEKRFTEVTDLSDGDNTLFGNKNRAAKQLQSVARQFGSIGKSMSKKLKKNFGSITKVAKTKKSDSSRNRILCAEIHTKRHEYQDEMIKNYLQFAQKRFLQDQKHKLAGGTPENLRLQEQALLEGPLKCINVNCDSFGTVLTSYMCDRCYEMQRNEELSKINTDSRFGTGRSKFYRDSDLNSYDVVKNLPQSKPSMNTDRTLYLSKSTFYYDTGLPFENEQIPNFKEPIDAAPLYSVKFKDDNANRSSEPDAANHHISKFDFGNINQNLNRSMVDQHNDEKNSVHLSDVSIDTLETDLKNRPNLLDSHTGDSLQFFMNKKKIKDQLTKEKQNSSQNVVSSNGSYNKDGSLSRSVQDLNENKSRVRVPNYMENYDTDIKKSATSIPNSAAYSLSRKYPDYELNSRQEEQSRGIEPRQNVASCAVLQQCCKSNHCSNLASAHTDFYCSKCNKERKVAGIII